MIRLKIQLYWPKCKFQNGEWGQSGIDSYWVECTSQESEEKVFKYLSSAQIKESKRNWEPRKRNSKDFKIETDRLCYLVSKDLKSIMSFPWYYPYSGQWNAYCPFERIKEIEIQDLSEVSNISIEE